MYNIKYIFSIIFYIFYIFIIYKNFTKKMQDSLINYITTNLNLTNDIKNVSIVDHLKLKINNKKVNELLKSYKNPTKIEKYLIDLELSECSKTMTLLEQNYFNNLLFNIYFVISNPYSIDSNDFIKLSEDKTDIITQSAVYIILILEKMIETNDLYKFYNHFIIKKWIKSIIQKPIKKEEYFNVSKLDIKNKEIRWLEYLRIFDIYNKSCMMLKNYLIKLDNFYNKKELSNPGCFTLSCNITKDLYKYCLESHTGLKLDLQKLETWAMKELDNLVNKMKQILKLIDPNIDMSKSHIELLKYTSKIYNQNYKSKEEFVEHHKKIIDKYYDIFINKYKFKEYDKLNLIVFDNKLLAGGYYNNNNFYINTAFWEKSPKYNAESLILHEAYPGHHLQIHPYKYLPQKDNLLYLYFPDVVNGFWEGWGLFSETLGSNQTNWDKIGMIEYDIFRTIRVVVDIRIHTKDYNPQKTMEFIKQYLNFNEDEINSEVYRYVVLPGQAVSYKIGSEIFKYIMKQKQEQQQQQIDPLSPIAIEIYKKIIDEGSIPLNFFIEQYNIDINKIFN